MERKVSGDVLPNVKRSTSLSSTPSAPPTLSMLNKAFNDLTEQFRAQPARNNSAPVVRNTLSAQQLSTLDANATELHRGKKDEGEVVSPLAQDTRQRSATPPPRSLPPLDAPKKKSNASPRARRLSGKGDAEGKLRDGRIKVVVRKRPFMPGEEGEDASLIDADTITLTITKQRIDLTEYTEKTTFNFDNVFNTDSTNRNVYDSCVLELLEVALSGGSASCFAYGQTGSGKTHTMMGCEKEKGLYAIAAEELFKKVDVTKVIRIAFYEIYCNSLYDLLHNRAPVVLREDLYRKMNICGLTWHELQTVNDLLSIVESGLEQRTTSSNSVNEHSSRSHAVMCIQVADRADPDTPVGTLNFVDLAGSERAADTSMNDKQTKMEGAEINKSLLALKECIRALDEKRKHIPFRGSKLTEVLRDSFTGNSKTVMIANISPSSLNFDHTANTLRYAFRVKGLSVASLTPSRERNAPRPFQLGPSRSPQKVPESPSKRARSAAKRNGSPQPSEGRHSKLLSLEDEKELLARGNRAEGSSLPVTNTGLPCICSTDSIQQYEREIRRKVMQQVQQDIGNEIQHALDERDGIIFSLQEENRKLLAQIQMLQNKNDI